MYYRDISRLFNLFTVVFHFCHLSEISAGVFLSQSITYFYRYLITCLGPISDRNRIPNQPNIELTKRKIPPFKLGTSLLTVFIFRTFCFGSQSTLRAHLIRDSYRSKFTKTFTVVDYWQVYLSISEIFENNLVKLNRPNFTSNITSTRTEIASSLE